MIHYETLHSTFNLRQFPTKKLHDDKCNNQCSLFHLVLKYGNISNSYIETSIFCAPPTGGWGGWG